MKILWILLIFAFNTFAAVPLQNKAQELLPSPLNSFKTHKTTLSEVEKKIGKANLVEGQKHYWERDGLKYALQLIFDKKSVLQSIHYSFTGNRPELHKIGEFDVKRLAPFTSGGATAGRYYSLKEENVEVVIDPINKTIRSVKIQ